MYSSEGASQDMETVLHHPDMTKLTNGNSIREEDEEEDTLRESYVKCPEILPVEPLMVSYRRQNLAI